MLALILQHNEALKYLKRESNMITIALLQAKDILGISSDTLKA